MELELFTGDRRLIEWLRGQCGGRFVPFPKAARLSSTELLLLVTGAQQYLGTVQAGRSRVWAGPNRQRG